jgi:hypothetical protein
MDSSNETKWAMFWAALAAQCAGETSVTANRIAVALLRTDSFHRLAERLQLVPADVIAAIEDPRVPSFEECERRVRQELAGKGMELASKEHQATVELRPLEPPMKDVIGAILEEHGHLGVAPMELLRRVVKAEPVIAARLAEQGVTAEAMEEALGFRR